MRGSRLSPKFLFFGAAMAGGLALVLLAVIPANRGSAAGGLNLNNTVSTWEFIIPGGPSTQVTSTISSGAAAPFAVDVNDVVTGGLFPLEGEILVSTTEVMVYDNNDLTGTGPCGAQDASTFCVTARAKVGGPDEHDPPGGPFDAEGRVRLATQLTAPLAATPQTTLESSMTAGAAPPFAITIGDGVGFPAAGQISITHQDVDAGGAATEYFAYDGSCGNGPGGNPPQLCVTARVLNPNNSPSAHPADGYAQPCSDNNAVTCPQPGVSKVTLHADAAVKDTAGFFPASRLYVFDIADPGGGELVDAVHGDGAAKLAAVPANNFRLVSRGGATAGIDKTTIQAHAAGDVVVGADEFVTCRVRFEQPGAFAGAPAHSVGAFMVCYSRTEPGDVPKDGPTGKLNVPIAGSTFVILNGLSQPFLSTGGFTHTLYGPVPEVDTDGTAGDANDCDGDANTSEPLLCLITPCITGFLPGVNLSMFARIDTDKSYATADTGTIGVALDTITGPTGGTDGNPATHDDCDDPRAFSDLLSTAYIYPGSGTPVDTDGDGCSDDRELDNSLSSGGQRDPWNPHDFYDPNGNGSVELGEIFSVAGKFGAVAPGPPYTTAEDRGPTYGPFGHNTSQPDGSIALADVFNVHGQLGHACDPAIVSKPPPSGTDCGSQEAAICLGAEGDEVSCGATKCTAAFDEPFVVTLEASEPPSGGYGGFQGEVFFDGLNWSLGACDVVWVDAAADLCLAGPGGQARIASYTALLPPRPSSTDSGTLAEIDVSCPGVGQHELALTHAPNADFGAAYFDTDGDPIAVTVEGQQDVDPEGNGTLVTADVADALVINCVSAGAPTSTFTPTATNTPEPTATFIPKQGLIFPVAGGGVGDGFPGTSAAVSAPADVETGNSVYVADAGHCRIRLLDDFGEMSTIAGTGDCGDAGDEGAAVDAELDNPSGVSVDGPGDVVFIADTGNCRVRAVDVGTGEIEAFAGTGDCGLSGNGGGATSAELDGPYDVLIDGTNLYIVDRGNCQLRLVSGGIITRVAGDAGGVCASTGDGGLAINAQLDDPRRVALDASGNLYLSEACAVRKIDTGGTITTVAGTGTCGFDGDGAGTSVQLNGPDGVAIDSSGDLLIADANNCRVRELSGGTLTTIAGTGTCGFDGDGGDATTLQLNDPAGIDVDDTDRLFVADRGNDRVRRIGSPIATVAGTGLPDFCGDTFLAIAESCLDSPNDLVVDTAGNVFIADTGNLRVRWVDVTSGSIYTIAGKTDLSSCPTVSGVDATTVCLPEPVYLALDEDQELLFVSDHTRNQVWALNLSGLSPVTPPTATRVAGSSMGLTGSCIDGASALGACLDAPTGLAFQKSGSDRYLFIGQENNGGAVARVDLDTFAIREVFDNTIATADIELGLDGPLYVAQPADQRIRRVYHGGNGLVEGSGFDAGETVAVVAGDGSTGQPTEGGLAISEPLNGPFGLGRNIDGGLLIGDRDNHTLWGVNELNVATPYEIDGGPNERIFRIAGDGSYAPDFCGDPKPKGNPATPPNPHQAREACIDSPAGIDYHFDAQALFFADAGNNRVRKVPSDCDADGLTDKFEDGFPGNYTPEPGFPTPIGGPLDRCKTDSDLDGCWDSQELGINAAAGGMRDPTNFWDVYDVDTENGPGAGAHLQGAIGLSDIFEVAGRFGQVGDSGIDPLSDADTMDYHPRYDRTQLGPNQWNTGPADGAVALSDVFAIAAQFAHSCI